VVAFVVDLYVNREFYFAIEATPGLRIFVAGPYGDNEPPEVIEQNVRNAESVGKQLALKGHFPFIPHTMLHGWETDKRFTVDHFKSIDFRWLDFCDALYFIAHSAGTDAEVDYAVQKGLTVFSRLEDVPDLRAGSSPPF
jgi:hypothetical protein